MNGLRVGGIEERVSLYADDMLLYLQDPGASLSTAFWLIQEFGDYSGFRINWSKSFLFAIDDTVSVPADSPIQLSQSFKYLGVVIQLPISGYLDLNLRPVMEALREKVQRWRNMPLTVMGRINLIKMIFLPKLLYVLSNASVYVSVKLFKRIDSIVVDFLWGS